MNASATDLTQLLGRLLDNRLAAADRRLAADYPGDHGGRQPIHTVYIPADQIAPTTIQQWSDQSLATLDPYADDPAMLADTIDEPAELVDQLLPRVISKLQTEPIEDLRIDFEDGLGAPGDVTEDRLADEAAALIAGWSGAGSGLAPAQSGIRFKSFEQPVRRRGLRTLIRFIDGLADRGVRRWPILTLPKVTSIDQVAAMVEVCRRLETQYGLADRTMEFELQIETTQAIIDSRGRVQVAAMIQAAEGRCRGLHFGTYDYSAACGIAAEYQSMRHPAADFAKAAMQVAAAGTGVRLSDGSNNLLPVGDRDQVRAAWKLQARLVRRSLRRGFYQGWDLHPAQLPVRYLATYAFYRHGFDSAAARLADYLANRPDSVAQSRSTQRPESEPPDGDYLDEPATAVALAGFCLRGLACGALDAAEVSARTGLTELGLATLAHPKRPVNSDD